MNQQLSTVENTASTQMASERALVPLNPEYREELLAELHETTAELGNLHAGRADKLVEGARSADAIRMSSEKMEEYVGGLATDLYERYLTDGKTEAEAAQLVDVFVVEKTGLLLGAMTDKRTETVAGRSAFMPKWATDMYSKAVETWGAWKAPEGDGALVLRMRESGMWRHLERTFSGNTRSAKVGQFALVAAQSSVNGVENLFKHRGSRNRMMVSAALGATVGGLAGVGLVAAGAGGAAVLGGTLFARSLIRTGVTSKLDRDGTVEGRAMYDKIRMEGGVRALTKEAYSVQELLDYVNKETRTMIFRNDARLMGGVAVGVIAGLLGRNIAQGIGWGAGKFLEAQFGTEAHALPIASPSPLGNGNVLTPHGTLPTASATPSGGGNVLSPNPHPSPSALPSPLGNGNVLTPNGTLPTASAASPNALPGPLGNGNVLIPNGTLPTASAAGPNALPGPLGNGNVLTPNGTLPTPSTAGDAVIEQYLAQHPDAMTIRPGEGWYETFKELGIKQSDWPNVLKALGKEGDLKALYDIKASDGKTTVLEWHSSSNEPWVRMTPDHKMPPAILQALVKYAGEHDYLKNPLANHATTTPAAAGAMPVGNGQVVTPEGTTGASATTAETFTVQKRSGIIGEMREWAASHPKYKNIAAENADKVYAAINGKYGPAGIIDVKDVNHDGVSEASNVFNDTTQHNGDTWIASPGVASWRAGVESDLEKLFDARLRGEAISLDMIKDTGVTSGATDTLPAGNGQVVSPEGTVGTPVETLVSVDSLNLNSFHPDTLTQTLDLLNKAHVINLDKDQYGDAIKQVGSMFASRGLTFYDRIHHDWRLYEDAEWTVTDLKDAASYLQEHFTLAA